MNVTSSKVEIDQLELFQFVKRNGGKSFLYIRCRPVKKMSAAEFGKGNGKGTTNKSIKILKHKFENFWYRNSCKSLQKLQIKFFGTMAEMAHFFFLSSFIIY